MAARDIIVIASLPFLGAGSLPSIREMSPALGSSSQTEPASEWFRWEVSNFAYIHGVSPTVSFIIERKDCEQYARGQFCALDSFFGSLEKSKILIMILCSFGDDP